jgi:hypothetical protein
MGFSFDAKRSDKPWRCEINIKAATTNARVSAVPGASDQARAPDLGLVKVPISAKVSAASL